MGGGMPVAMSGAMPQGMGDGMPAGMGGAMHRCMSCGMSGAGGASYTISMDIILNDPDLVAAFGDPEDMAALQDGFSLLTTLGGGGGGGSGMMSCFTWRTLG